MRTTEFLVRRISVVSLRPFDDVVARLTATIGRPDMRVFHRALEAAATLGDLEQVVRGAIGSYAPVTILVDERAGGVHLSYDTMASQLAPYRNAAALAVARDLDAKVGSLIETAAR